MDKSKIIVYLAIIFSLFFAFQNCTTDQFSGKYLSVSGGGGNGSGYDGKLVFAYIETDFKCEGQVTPKSYLELNTDKSWTLKSRVPLEDGSCSTAIAAITEVSYEEGSSVATYQHKTFVLSNSQILFLPKLSNLVWYWSMSGMPGLQNPGKQLPVDIGSTTLNLIAPNNSVFSLIIDHLDLSLYSTGVNNAVISGGTAAELADLWPATYSTWIKIDPTNSASLVYVKDDNNGNSGFWIETSSAFGKVGFAIVYSMCNMRLFTNEVPPDGTWFHLAITLSGSYNSGGGENKAKIFIDGVPVNNYSTKNNGCGRSQNSDANRPFYIGGRPNSLAFRGALDEFGIWNRDLLAEEIQMIYSLTR
jgi:hypothetical protein